MRKLQISKEHRALIESVIRENPKFKGHEYLIDKFCDAIYKKSYLLIDAIRDMSRLRRHLAMISDSCMDTIIKDKKKYDDKKLYNEIIQKSQNEQELVSLKSNKNEQNEYQKPNVVNLKEEIQRSEKYDSVDGLTDPLENCPRKIISSSTIEKLVQIVKKIDDRYPQKKYYEIFSLRYIRRYSQTEIARNLKISQVELSKRFVELTTLTKDNAY